jgi:hypothetical protein
MSYISINTAVIREALQRGNSWAHKLSGLLATLSPASYHQLHSCARVVTIASFAVPNEIVLRIHLSSISCDLYMRIFFCFILCSRCSSCLILQLEENLLAGYSRGLPLLAIDSVLWSSGDGWSAGLCRKGARCKRSEDKRKEPNKE